MSCTDWKKLLVPASSLGHDAFADWFRFGPNDAPQTPLVVYIGGAISEEIYQERSPTRPDAIATEFENALSAYDHAPPDLLVIPCPLSMYENRTQWRSNFLAHFSRELLPIAPNPEPSRIASVGFSLGSFYALSLVMDNGPASGIATLGGVGMAEAFLESENRDLAGRRIICFANESDDLSAVTRKFQTILDESGIMLEIVSRTGRHTFSDYADNQSAKDAFLFSMNCLSQRGHWIA